MFKYKIPQGVKAKFTKEFMEDFLKELIRIFNLSEPISYSDSLLYLESTYGWVDAFRCICQKYKLENILTYYDNLEWYDSDLFDDEVGSLMIKYGLINN